MNSKSFSVLTNAVQIKQGEYLPAYFARLLSYSSFITPQEFYASLGLTTPRVGEGYLPLWVIKVADAKIIEKSFWEIIDEHMCGHFWRPFVPEGVLLEHIKIQHLKGSTGRVLFHGEKLLSQLNPLKYCARCRDEEVSKFGFPVWKSRNQLATVFTCDVHGDTLHQKLNVTSAAPDGKTVDEFEQTGGYQPEISMLHRWFEFESELIKHTEPNNGKGFIPVYRSVFLESSFYSGKNKRTDKHLSFQWLKALRLFLTKLYPHMSADMYAQMNSKDVQLSAILNNDKPLHPMLLLMFRTFYMWQFRA